MGNKLRSFFFSSRLRGSLSVLALGLLVALFSLVRYRVYGHFEGLYVLKGEERGIVIKDDLVLGDEGRLLLALPFEPLYDFLRGDLSHAQGGTYLQHEWFTSDGSGFVVSHNADGTKLATSFSRFLDSSRKETKGIFVGGGLSYDFSSDKRLSMNETGMTFFDGTKWNHLWCNVNESISPWHNPSHIFYPSDWRFLNSKKIKSTDDELIVTSSHEVEMDGLPFRVDRSAFFRAGARYFTLAIRITNIGKAPAGYYYVYGDEPWVGDYGSSAGNVGWLRDRLFQYEGVVDLARYSWAGFFDYGNDAAGEPHTFSGMANFIEWQGDVRPNLVYFSNRTGFYADEKDRVPLSHPSNRVLFLQWGPRLLDPGQSETIVLAIGMADSDPANGFPVKPETTLTPAAYDFLLKPRF